MSHSTKTMFNVIVWQINDGWVYKCYKYTQKGDYDFLVNKIGARLNLIT